MLTIEDGEIISDNDVRQKTGSTYSMSNMERQCNECGERLATDWDHGWVCLSCGEPREGPTRE